MLKSGNCQKHAGGGPETEVQLGGAFSLLSLYTPLVEYGHSTHRIYIFTVNCTFQEMVNSCNGSVTLEADPVAFIHSQSSVITRVNSSDSNETLSYNLCIIPPKFLHTELIGCTHNGTEVAIDVDWKRAGVTIVSVFIYDEGKSFMGCARTNITIAG